MLRVRRNSSHPAGIGSKGPNRRTVGHAKCVIGGDSRVRSVDPVHWESTTLQPVLHIERPLKRRSSVSRRVIGLAAVLACALTTALGATALEPTIETAPEPVAEETGRWQYLDAVAEGFRALLPRDETWEVSGLRNTVIGTVSEKQYFARSEGRTFSVGLHMLPKLGKLFAPSALILSNAKKNVLLTDSGRLVSYERQRMGDYPGALLTYESTSEDDDYGLMEAHLVLVGQRLYVLKASQPGSGASRGDTDLFFDSFEVIK